MDELNPIVCEELAGDNGGQNGGQNGAAKHGFFTRQGGESTGIYEGLNVGLGSGDDRENVLANRARVAKYFDLGSENLATLYQVHSARIITVTSTEVPERPKADGMVTNVPGLAIGILTADCGPVLLCDQKNGVVGASHAGWQGAMGGVLENTVEAMENIGGQREHIHATLGPTISQENYEIGPEFVTRLVNDEEANTIFLKPSRKNGHAMFDLPGYIIGRLSRAGVSVRWTGHCTYENEEDYFSYRRTTHRNEPDYGRQISAIALL